MAESVETPWQIVKSDPQDQPPEYIPGLPWVVIHPRAFAGRKRRETRYSTHREALAFVLRDPEFRRLTQRREPSRG